MDAGNLCWLERTHHTVFSPLSALAHLNRRRVKGERLIRCNATAVPHRLEFMSSIWTEAAFAVYVRFVNEICRQEGVGVRSRSALWHIIVENLTFQSSSEHNFNCGGRFIHVKVFHWWCFLLLPDSWRKIQCFEPVPQKAVLLCKLLSSPSCLWLTGVKVVVASHAAVCDGGCWVQKIERDGKSVCHFIQALLFLTRILTPVLSISISRWLTKDLLSLRQILVGEWVCVFALRALTWVNGTATVCADQHILTWPGLAALACSTKWLCLLPSPLHWDHQNAVCFPKTWFHKWKNSICFPAASHMAVIVAHMNWSR